MPTYTYKREDGSVFDYEQKITEDPLQTCPTTGQKVKRVISGGAGLVFKGSGFYLTDYVKKNGESKKTSKSDDSKDSSTKTESKSESSTSSDSSSSSSDSKKSSSTGSSSE